MTTIWIVWNQFQSHEYYLDCAKITNQSHEFYLECAFFTNQRCEFYLDQLFYSALKSSWMVVLTQYADDMFLHFGFSECRVDGVAVDHFVSVLRSHWNRQVGFGHPTSLGTFALKPIWYVSKWLTNSWVYIITFLAISLCFHLVSWHDRRTINKLIWTI